MKESSPKRGEAKSSMYALLRICFNMINANYSSPLQMPILSTKDLCQSELWLRRAHHVLAWIFHFYVHTHPPARANERSDIVIPPSLTLPLLRVSTQLELPPVVSYADSVLYNWDFARPPSSPEEIPIPSNLRCQTLF